MAYIPFLNNAYFSAKVGIGTTSPDSKLEIFDSSSSTDPTTLDSNFLLLTNGDATEVSETWGVGFNTKNSLGTNKLGAYVHAIGNYSSNYNTSLAFGTRGVTAGTSATERMRIDSAGNVGIGTTNPQAPLVISNSSTDGLEFHNSISSSSRIISYKRSNNTFRPLRLEALTHIFSISGNEKMRIDSSGNVGIGTTSPGGKLEVDGQYGDLKIGDPSLGTQITYYDTTRILMNSADIKFYTNSLTERMTIESNGNVGIGTASPTFKLHVNSADASDDVAYIHHDNPAQSSGDVLKVRSDAGDNAGSALLNVQNNTGSALYVRGDRNVGIGTDSPSVKLDIRLSGTTGKVAELHNSVGYGVGFTVESDGGVNTINSESNQALAFATNGSSNERIRITSGGNVGIGTTSPGSKLSIGGTTGSYGSGIGFEPTGTGARIYRTFIGTDGSFRFDDVTAGFLTRLAITSSGNVGIGTTSPSAKLDVDGDVRISGGIEVRSGNKLTLQRPNNGVATEISTDSTGAMILNSINDEGFFFNNNGTNAFKLDPINATFAGLVSGITPVNAANFVTKAYVDGSGGGSGPFLPLAGGTMTGVTQFNDHTQHGDQVSAKWGASNDLTIQHNGTNSVIANSVGNLYISNHADDKDIIFESDNGSGASVSYLTLDGSTTHAYFSNPGNVGIGTTSPSQKLQVSTSNYNVSKFVGNTSNGTGYVGAVLEIETNNDERGRGVYLTHRNATDTSDSEWYAGVPYNGGGYSIGNAAYATSIDSAAGPAHKDQSKLFIAESGNVGIGTTSPALQSGGTGLHIDATTSSELKFTNDTTGITASDGTALVSTGNNFTINNREAGNITLGTSNSTRMTILSAGNVGIGTTSPGTALHVVSGGIGVQGTSGAAALTAPGIWMGSDGTNALIYGRQSNTWKPTYLDSSALYINAQSGGNVGIGTTSPTANLDVTSTLNQQHLYVQGGYAEGTGALARIKTTGNGNVLLLESATTSDSREILEVKNTNGTVFLVRGDGNVGIGTTSPSAKLEVAGAISTGNGASVRSEISSPIGSGNASLLFASNAGNINTNTAEFIFTNSLYGSSTRNELMRIDSSGYVGIGTASPSEKLHVDGNTLISAEKYYYTAGTGGGFGSDASGNFKIRQNDADLIFGSGNNVGIGTTSPLEKLEVQGTVYATPISYAANQSAYALKMGASNNTAFDMGIKAKSTSTGGPYMSFCSANTDDVIVVKNSNVGINTANPSYNLDVTGNGRFTSTVTATNFILSSDKRLKNNVEEVNNNHIDVNWKTFEMNSEEGQSRYGVIAQELEEVHPEFVRTDDEGMKSVAYIDLLIAKIAELEARLEKLEK